MHNQQNVIRRVKISSTQIWFSAMLLCAALTGMSQVHAQDNAQTGGPYVPTPQIVVDQMLRLAAVDASDYVMDLGSGDGVIVLTAAKDFKASGMGIEIDADLVRLSNERARSLKVDDKVTFAQLDIFKSDLSKASVVALYLLPEMMIDIRTKLLNELKPGSRIVSHDYHFGDWLPDERISLDVAEKELINGAPRATVYLWRVPARVDGSWHINVSGGKTYQLALRQQFQVLEGAMAGNVLRPQSLTLRGSDIAFALPDGHGIARFSGRVSGDAMEGTVALADGRAPIRWTAMKTDASARQTQ